MKNDKIYFRTVIFDLDGVLIDSEKIAIKAWLEGGKMVGLKIPHDVIVKTAGHPVDQRIHVIENLIGSLANQKDYLKSTGNIYLSLLFNSGNLLKDGAEELIIYLKENNYKIGVATSSGLSITEKILKKHKIYDYFDAIVASDHIRHNKPNPEIYVKSLEILKAEKKESIVIEDSENGSQAAFSAGLRTILIPDIADISEETLKKFSLIFPTLLGFLKYLKSYELQY